MTGLGDPIFLEFSSVFHLMSGLAYTEKLRNQGENCQLYLHHASYWNNQKLSEHHTKLAKEMGALFLEEKEFQSIQKQLLKKRQPHIRLKINTAIENPLINQRTVQIDDGIGAYRTNFASKARSIVNEYQRMKVEPFHRAAKVIFKLAVKELLSKIFKAEHFGIFSQGMSCPTPNREYSTLLRGILEKSVYLRKSEKLAEKCPDPYLLFLSQPAIQLGWCDEKSYKEMLERLSNWAIEKHGANLVIKKHPADGYGYSNNVCVEFDGIAEELFAANPPTAVFTICSTSALTAKIVFDIPSYIISTSSFSGPQIFDDSLNKIFSAYTETITLS